MSQTSHLSRYRPAVLAVTGVAAACGIYVLYTAFSDLPAKTGLHRSNAIHRARTERPPRLLIEWTRPTMEAPLGILEVSWGDTTTSSNIVKSGVPRARDVTDGFSLPENNHLLQRQLNVAAIQSVLQACFLARFPGHRTRLTAMGLGALCEVLADREIDAVRELATTITLVLPDVSTEQLDLAITKFENSELYLSSVLPDSDDLNYADTEEIAGPDDRETEPSQGLKGLLYHIAETDAIRKAYEHRGIHCEECSERPIRGIRWHCLNCPDFDLCSTCEASTGHPLTHVFAKIKIPMPVLSQPTNEYPLWYPGDPRKIHPPFRPALKKRLQDEYEIDGPHLDAHYDQFTCMANVPWPQDPNDIRASIDRRAFNKALTSERWPARFRPNAMYDRMFAFYDTNNDGLIGFEEFVDGLAYLRGPKRYTPLTRALQGFDIDGDGFVERDDFLRLFRAKHEIQELIIGDMVEGQEIEQTRNTMETLRSGQPISSIFALEEIPRGEHRPRTGKAMDAFGDMQPLPGTKTVLNDDEGWEDEHILRKRLQDNRTVSRQPHQRLQQHFSRFEEMLGSPTNEVDGGNSPRETGEHNASVGEAGLANGASHTEEDDPATQDSAISRDSDTDEPLNQDILWQIVEDGFHEMLDPLFKAKEQEDEEVIETRGEREEWKEAIEEVLKRGEDQLALQEALNTTGDPLLAVAMAASIFESAVSLNAGKVNGHHIGPEAFVPTDAESLAKREEQIAQQPLDELLSSTGYAVKESQDSNGNGSSTVHQIMTTSYDSVLEQPRPELASRSTDTQPLHCSVGSLSELPQDPTMPQNRLNTLTESQEHSVKPKQPPSKGRLAHLAVLKERDRVLKARGGPGRLKYEEVEELVKADDSQELRGLIVSWLEWASF